MPPKNQPRLEALTLPVTRPATNPSPVKTTMFRDRCGLVDPDEEQRSLPLRSRDEQEKQNSSDDDDDDNIWSDDEDSNPSLVEKTLFCDRCNRVVAEEEFREEQLSLPPRSRDDPRYPDHYSCDDDDDGTVRLCAKCEDAFNAAIEAKYQELLEKERRAEASTGRYKCSKCRQARDMKAFSGPDETTKKCSDDRVCNRCSATPIAQPTGDTKCNQCGMSLDRSCFTQSQLAKQTTKQTTKRTTKRTAKRTAKQEGPRCVACVEGKVAIVTDAIPPSQPMRRQDYKIVKGICPLCGGSSRNGGIFGRPDGDTEGKSYDWIADSDLESNSRCFYTCSRHRDEDLPLPWGEGLYAKKAPKPVAMRKELTLRERATLIMKNPVRTVPYVGCGCGCRYF